MALPDPKSHRISLDDAAAQARRHRGGPPTRGVAGGDPHKGGLFLRAELDQLLAQPGCAGLRFYYGRKDDGQDTLILVGVDEKGNDMENGVLLEDHFLCPPICGTANALNS
ncbi:MAG TPA: hypothetical protein VLB00_11805 [Gemmatimonadales bacterium]|nr:hypothetical protein [Gemmatimonadales bacterium]